MVIKNPQALSIDDLIKKLDTNVKNGLTEKEVDSRLQSYGPNELAEPKPQTVFSIFLDQFKSPLIFILLLAAVIVGIAGDWIDAVVIGFILIFNACIATFQEYRAFNILLSLRHFVPSFCTVIRDGKEKVISAKELVPGDVVFLQEGERVPADARLIKSYNVRVDESILTGESEPVNKETGILPKEIIIFEQKNMVFKGTFFISGTAHALVVFTGINTEIGKIQQAIQAIDTESPLKKEIARLSKWIFIISSISASIFVISGLFWRAPWLDIFMLAGALFVAVIPEGLPVVLTLVLAAGAYKLAYKKVLIKKLQAVEGLSRVDVIVMDKTGTLTRNEMMVLKLLVDDKEYDVTGKGYIPEGKVLYNDKQIDIKENERLVFFAKMAALIDSSVISFDLKSKTYHIKGEPIEAALGIFAGKIGIDKDEIRKEFTKVYELPFESKTRIQIVGWKKSDKVYFILLGSPESVFNYSKSVSNITEDKFQEYLNEGLRMVALAYKEVPLKEIEKVKNIDDFVEGIKKNFNFLALIGIEDAIRQSVAEMVDKAIGSGIMVIIATGDHKQTAAYVGKATGILKEGDRVLTGAELEKLSDVELDKQISNIRVFARVTPEDKLRIIRILQKKGKLVAMVGDGVNDAPSIVASDLGVAMGVKGTEVAQQAADMILLDDSFGSLVRAIELGRHIFYTIRRVVLYLLATNLGEVLVLLFSSIFMFRLPLLPVQILWLNIVTDGFLDLALSTEPQEKDILKYEWLKRLQKKGLIEWSMLIKILYLSSIMFIGSYLVFLFYYDNGSKAQTMTLLTMAAFQWFNAWNCRSEKYSIFSLGLLSNMWLAGATVLVVVLQFSVIHFLFLQKIFKTVTLNSFDWFLAIIVASSILFIEEIRKFIVRNRFF